MRFRFIAEHAATFEVAAMCETFGVSRSGYYAWKNRPASDTEQRTELLMIEIEDIHSKRKQAYGSPRVHQELLDRGHSCCVNSRDARAYGRNAPSGRSLSLVALRPSANISFMQQS